MVTGSLELVICGDLGLWIEGEVKGRPFFGAESGSSRQDSGGGNMT